MALGLCAGLFATGCTEKRFSPKPYLEDFEALKSHISKSYANLEYLIEYHQIDPYELNLKTISAIKASANEEQALEALNAFVATFKDGHFKLKRPEAEKSLNGEKTRVAISKTASSEQACRALGFSWDKDFGFKFPVEGVKVEDRGGGEFPYLVLQGKTQKVGIIRVADFRATVYPKSCVEAWSRYQSKFENECDEDCQEEFQYYFLRDVLVDNFYRSLEKVRDQNINALVIDLTYNRGGTDWVQDITAILTSKPVVCGRRGFVKHPHHEQNFKELLADIQENSPGDSDKIAAMEANVKAASDRCDLSGIWTKKNYKPTCSIVAYRKDGACKYSELKYPGKSKYNGKLYLLVDGNTASAAEDIVARHLDSGTADVIGSRTHGSGCGYINGGIKFSLPNTGLEVKVPDCIRARADGTNEVVGIEPTIKMDMSQLKEPTFLAALLARLEIFLKKTTIAE